MTNGRERNTQDLLFEISSILLKKDPLADQLQKVLELLSSFMQFERGTITIHNRKSGRISIEAGTGISPEEQARGVYRPGEGITGKVIETGRPAVVPDISKEPAFLNKTKTKRNLEKDRFSFISVPVRAGQEIIGTLNVDRKQGMDAEIEQDLKMIQIISAMISQAVQLYQAQHEENLFLIEENARLNRELQDRFSHSYIIGTSKVMRRVFDYVKKISDTAATVLILGESGTGKELVARSIHYASSRKNKPFVKFNCAALPESIIESELFGHEKGAFTGAVRERKGRFELAQGGTIFLDEIGELSINVQSKLLRVLQEREFERVGGTETIKCDVRVIAATNRNLEESIRNNTFREDLYYRLNIIPLTVPPPEGEEIGYSASGKSFHRKILKGKQQEGPEDLNPGNRYAFFISLAG